MNVNTPQTGIQPPAIDSKWIAAGFSDYRKPHENSDSIHPTHWSRYFPQNPGPYEAFPAGDHAENVHHILERVNLNMSRDFSHRGPRNNYEAGMDLIYQIAFRDAEKAIIYVCYGFKDEDLTGTRLQVVTVGFPDEPATTEQKEKLAELMGLTLDDLIRVYIPQSTVSGRTTT
ncbi:hypothetical protein NLJ89_g4793 [Agrocybe chaxingu]|uniref:Uncharacterized protein n=1 Tax=Agrocybe chaxingu TaxID=84603 RepID=A0A9W8MXR2_9AGAR|nr:hypothetical protein NLJ89_g4793 [Agrocybe chaxingu]